GRPSSTGGLFFLLLHAAPVDATTALSLAVLRASRRFQKCSFLQFRECLPQLLLRIHHDRTVPGDRLLERLAGDQQEPHSILSRLNGNFVAAIKEDERAVVCFRGRGCVRPLDRLGRNRERTRCVAEFSTAGKNVSECVPARLNRKALALARRDGYVEVDGIGGDSVHGTCL